MRQRWSPLKAAIVTALIIIAIGIVVGGVLAGMGKFGDHAFASGEQFGQGLAPLMIAAAVAAYFVQRARIAKDK